MADAVQKAMDNVNNTERRLTESLVKAQKKEIQAIMNLRPDAITHIIAKLGALGLRLEDITKGSNGSTILPQSAQAKAHANRRGQKRKGTDSAAAADGCVADISYHCLERCSPSFLMSILEVCEPNALSSANIKKHLARGKADDNKKTVQRMVEFVTGQTGELKFEKNLAVTENLHKFVKEQAEKRGRRGRDLNLLPHWPRDGLLAVLGYDATGQGLLRV